MKRSDTEHLQHLMDSAAAGQLTRSDVVSIFMFVRGDAPRNSMLRDIGDSIAHENRDRGFAFDYVEKYVQHVHDVFTNGGVLAVGMFLPVDVVLAQLAKLTAANGIQTDRRAMAVHRDVWTDRLASILDGTTFDTPLASGKLQGGPPPALTLRFKHDVSGVIQVPAGMPLGFPLLVDFTPA